MNNQNKLDLNRVTRVLVSFSNEQLTGIGVLLQKFQDEFEITMISKHTKMSEQIKEYCLKYGRDSREEDPDLSNFIVSEKYKLVYCSVPKVACTVWKRILANLEGLNITKGVHKYTKGKLKLLSNYSLEEREKILKTYKKKFMFVREPFERLLSAYRDCFFGKFKTTVEYWKDYRKFIKEVLVNSSGHYNDSLPANDDLTFEQFSTYLVLRWRQGKRFQEHWREQYNLCHPCRIKFDFIGHYETLAEDALFILRKTNLEDKVFFPEWQPTDTSSLMQKYYSTLSLLRIKQLQNIYNKDFELFGYEYPGALQMIVDNLINDKL